MAVIISPWIMMNSPILGPVKPSSRKTAMFLRLRSTFARNDPISDEIHPMRAVIAMVLNIIPRTRLMFLIFLISASRLIVSMCCFYNQSSSSATTSIFDAYSLAFENRFCLFSIFVPVSMPNSCETCPSLKCSNDNNNDSGTNIAERLK